jgi:hypothetical protein
MEVVNNANTFIKIKETVILILRSVAILIAHYYKQAGRDSIAGIETRYGLDGTRIEFRGGEAFCSQPDRSQTTCSLLYNGYRVSFPGVKRPRSGANHPPHLAPRLKKEQSYTSTSPLGLRGLF